MVRNIYHREGDAPQKVQNIKTQDSMEDPYGMYESDDGMYLKPQYCEDDMTEGVSFCKPMHPNDMIENNSTANNEEY